MAAKDFVTRFLTDLTRWRVSDAAADLDDVASSADRTERSLTDVEGAASRAGRELADVDAGTVSRELTGVDDAARRAEGGLDDVAGAARDAEGDLASVGSKAKDAGADVDAAGDDADAAAERIADAFRKIKKSSDDDLGGVGDGARKGTREVSEATEEMGGEVREELVSMAGSFDGTFSSAADSAQALTSAIAQSLGPAAIGVGAAAAVGIGLWRAQTEKQTEAVAELRTRLRELRDGTTTVDEATRDWLDGLEAGDLKDLADDADDLGVSVNTLARAHAGDAEALGQVLPAIESYRQRAAEAADAVGEWLTPAAEMIGQTIGLQEKTADLSKTWGEAGEVAGIYAEALGQTSAEVEAATERQATYSDVLAAFVDPAAVYQAELQKTAQATADATADQSDSWETYAESTKVSLDRVLERLLKDVAAQESWATNMSTLAGRASAETLAYLGELGVQGAPLVQDLVDASDEKMALFNDVMRRRSEAGVASVAAAIEAGTPAAVDAAARQRDAIAAVYAAKIIQMVEVKADPRSISLVRQEAAQAANGAAAGAARSRP